MAFLPEPLTPAPYGCAAALAIGLLVVGAGTAALALMAGIAPDPAMFIVWSVVAAAPFGLLALLGIKGRATWLTGLLVTLMLWGSVFLRWALARMAGDPSGADIASGWLIPASPLVVLAACLIVRGRRT
jgi:hypothetical protein